MARIKWNAFLVKYTRSSCFASAVSRSLPKGMKVDKRGNKMPTPQGLFQEWAKANLQGDWTTTSIQGGFIIRVVMSQDEQLISQTFGVVGKPTPIADCGHAIPIAFRDSSYGRLARNLGYAV